METLERKLFVYDGPVYLFDKCLISNWTAQTTATSKKKAISNLAYRYKIENNLIPASNIKLDGKYLKEDI